MNYSSFWRESVSCNCEPIPTTTLDQLQVRHYINCNSTKRLQLDANQLQPDPTQLQQHELFAAKDEPIAIAGLDQWQLGHHTNCNSMDQLQLDMNQLQPDPIQLQ